jgi:hypothetical protein
VERIITIITDEGVVTEAGQDADEVLRDLRLVMEKSHCPGKADDTSCLPGRFDGGGMSHD